MRKKFFKFHQRMSDKRLGLTFKGAGIMLSRRAIHDRKMEDRKCLAIIFSALHFSVMAFFKPVQNVNITNELQTKSFL